MVKLFKQHSQNRPLAKSAKELELKVRNSSYHVPDVEEMVFQYLKALTILGKDLQTKILAMYAKVGESKSLKYAHYATEKR